LILVVENEVLIAMEIVSALEDAGAQTTMTTSARHAMILINHDGLAGAIMDHGLSDGDSSEVCARLKARGILYVSYSVRAGPWRRSRCAVHRQARQHGHAAGRDGEAARRA
jgi:CheY-like chemotaxis protein